MRTIKFLQAMLEWGIQYGFSIHDMCIQGPNKDNKITVFVKGQTFSLIFDPETNKIKEI